MRAVALVSAVLRGYPVTAHGLLDMREMNVPGSAVARRDDGSRRPETAVAVGVVEFDRNLHLVGKIIEPEKQRAVANHGPGFIGMICRQIKRVFGSRKTFGERKRVVDDHFFVFLLFYRALETIACPGRPVC